MFFWLGKKVLEDISKYFITSYDGKQKNVIF